MKNQVMIPVEVSADGFMEQEHSSERRAGTLCISTYVSGHRPQQL